MPRKSLNVVAAATLAALVLAAALLGAFAWLLTGDRRFPHSAQTIEVTPGQTVSDVARSLKAAGIISSSRLLEVYLRASARAATIQAADYDFAAHLTIPEVSDVLATGGRPAQVWVTIPEGFTAAQVAQRLLAHGLGAGLDFLSVARSTNLEIDGRRTRGLEGYLYPDTYLVPRNASAQGVARVMTGQFARHLPPDAAQLAHHLGYSIPAIVTVASMVEREAKVDQERALIAAVIYNRLRIGMPLEIDATIEYALPRHKAELSLHDLTIDSPYNTYKRVGLPPTPISNPGRRSLLAAFHPAKVDFLYYVYRGHGRHQFSRTLQEQQAAESKYLH